MITRPYKAAIANVSAEVESVQYALGDLRLLAELAEHAESDLVRKLALAARYVRLAREELGP